ncbi:transposase family protein [Streptococcus dentapri]|uniref:Transposase family protein n=1 Tax=Streptococcus dentapri TaxID=573564 RepID=A0ABV8D224_9STRE
MGHIKNTTELLGIKDPNITINFILQHQTHLEIRAELDYEPSPCLHCGGQKIKYGFQKASKIPLLDAQGFPSLLRLKKRRFQCKSCHRVTVVETPIVDKNHQISHLVWQKLTQLLNKNRTNTDIARILHFSVSTVQRKLAQFTFKEDYTTLPEIISWDEFARNKGKFAFIA